MFFVRYRYYDYFLTNYLNIFLKNFYLEIITNLGNNIKNSTQKVIYALSRLTYCLMMTFD